MQDSIAIYSILIISICILYIAIKSRTLNCSTPILKEKVVKPVKVSEIFKKMFSDREPIPEPIALDLQRGS